MHSDRITESFPHRSPHSSTIIGQKNSVRNLCRDRLAILNEGRLVGFGTPAELKKEIGGDVVTFELADPAQASVIAEKISVRFAVKTTALGGKVRLDRR